MNKSRTLTHITSCIIYIRHCKLTEIMLYSSRHTATLLLLHLLEHHLQCKFISAFECVSSLPECRYSSELAKFQLLMSPKSFRYDFPTWKVLFLVTFGIEILRRVTVTTVNCDVTGYTVWGCLMLAWWIKVIFNGHCMSETFDSKSRKHYKKYNVNSSLQN